MQSVYLMLNRFSPVGLARAYNKLLNRHPLKTQIVTSGLLVSTGDCLAQLVIERRKLRDYDVLRTAKFGVIGAFFVAPFLNGWFRLLERVNILPPRYNPLVRVLIDQTIASPYVQAGFIILLHAMDGMSLQENIAQWKKDAWDVYMASLRIWPATQLVNFYLVPLHMRVIVVQSVGLLWNIYFAWRIERYNSEKAVVVVDEEQLD